MLTRAIKFFRNQFRSGETSGLAKPSAWLRDAFDVQETIAGIDITAESSLNSSAVAACVRLLADSVASLPLHVYRAKGSDKERAPEHPAYGKLHDAPNEFQTSFVWRQLSMAHVLLHGNAYTLIDRDQSGRAAALWPLHPSSVRMRAEGSALLYDHWAGGKKRTYNHRDMLHFRCFTLDGFSGISVISMAREGIGLDQSMQRHGAALFKNQARPGLIVNTAQVFKPDVKAKLIQAYQEMFSGKNAGKTLVLEAADKVTPFGFSSEDAQFLGSRQFSTQEIARWFRVPPHMIGDNTRLAYASSEVEMLAFVQHSLRPWLECLEAELNRKLFAGSRHFAEFSVDGLARGDQASRYESYSKGLAAGFLTVADVRRWENLPFIEGTDKLLSPLNMGPRTGPGA